jgi:hypothetical protein
MQMLSAVKQQALFQLLLGDTIGGGRRPRILEFAPDVIWVTARRWFCSLWLTLMGQYPKPTSLRGQVSSVRPDVPDSNSSHDNPPESDDLGLPVDGDPDDVARAFLAMRDGQVRRSYGLT